MRYLKLLIVALSLIGGNIFSANYQEMFLQANELYKAEKYGDALSLYEEIPKPGSSVLYNSGNCAYKLGKKGLALAYWRQAEKVWGLWNRDDIRHNIVLVKKDLISGSNRSLKVYLSSLRIKLISLISNIPLFVLQILFLSLWLFLFLYLKYLYKRKRKVLIVLLFLAIAFFGTLLVLKYSLKFLKSGVVLNHESQLLSGPGSRFSQLGSLPETLEVAIKKEIDGYYKIKFAGNTGWVKREFIKEI